MTDFLAVRKMEHLNELEKKKSVRTGISPTETPSQNKLDYQKRKQLEKDQRKINNRIKKTEMLVEGLENNISEIDAKLQDPEKYSKEINSGELFKQYDILKKELEEKMEEWEGLHESMMQ